MQNFKTEKFDNWKELMGVRSSSVGSSIINRFRNNHKGNLPSCTVHVDSIRPLFVQVMHTNYYKIIKQLKSFKIIIVASTCFGLHEPSSGSAQPVLR